jgi:nucleotidyltransferase/DNA polymerase involved in DNA repair
MARCVLFAEVPAFYAAVARADDPTLAGRPVIVGGDPRKRGRVQAASADAIAAGVALDMPMLEALRHCPRARAVRTEMARYREVSRRLFAVLRGIEPQLEVFGLAALYADVSDRADASEELGGRLIGAVDRALGLPLRVGLGAGKFLARIAAEEVRGEHGVVRIAPGTEAAFLGPLPASRLDGVGRKTAATLAGMGAHTIADIVRLGRDRLQAELGPHGLRIYACATGSDFEPVRAARHPKSVSRESTLRGEPLDGAVFAEQLAGLAQQLEEELARMGLAAGRVAVKVRFADQGTTTRSATLPRPTADAAELRQAAHRLLERTAAGARPARGLGIQLSRLEPAAEADRQLDLFPPG